MIKIFKVIVWNKTQTKIEEEFATQILVQNEKILDLYRKADNELYTLKATRKYESPQVIQIIYYWVNYGSNNNRIFIEKPYDPV